MTRRQGRRRKKLLDDPEDRTGYSHVKEEALDRNMWRDRFGRGFEPDISESGCGSVVRKGSILDLRGLQCHVGVRGGAVG